MASMFERDPEIYLKGGILDIGPMLGWRNR